MLTQNGWYLLYMHADAEMVVGNNYNKCPNSEFMIHIHKREKFVFQLRKILENISISGSQHQDNDYKDWENPPEDSHQITFNYLLLTSLAIKL